MALRILKLIFLFIVLSPVQDQSPACLPEQDDSDRREGDAGSCFAAAMQESSQLTRTARLGERKLKDQKVQEQSPEFLAGSVTEWTSRLLEERTPGNGLQRPGDAKISSGLLRHCYQSKSSSRGKEARPGA